MRLFLWISKLEAWKVLENDIMFKYMHNKSYINHRNRQQKFDSDIAEFDKKDKNFIERI